MEEEKRRKEMGRVEERRNVRKVNEGSKQAGEREGGEGRRGKGQEGEEGKGWAIFFCGSCKVHGAGSLIFAVLADWLADRLPG